MSSEPLIRHQDLVYDLQKHLGVDSPLNVAFLAQGEYTLNYRVRVTGRDLVVRIVTGSQMGLPVSEQVEYEAHALRLLEPSGCTPGLVSLELEPGRLPYPLMIMEYLPGRPLDYRADLEAAARCAARIHRLGVPGEHRLQVHAEPERFILDEADQLLGAYLDWTDADPESAAALRRLAERVRSHVAAQPGVFDGADLAVINTDLNTHNFVVNDGSASLLDWEKARIGPTVQDLAHFLLPTTTLWRSSTSTRLSSDDEQRFLSAYLDERPELDRDRYQAQLDAMRSLALLRAIAWCSWAVYASAAGQRAIVNEETLGRCREYLRPEFLDSLAHSVRAS